MKPAEMQSELSQAKQKPSDDNMSSEQAETSYLFASKTLGQDQQQLAELSDLFKKQEESTDSFAQVFYLVLILIVPGIEFQA